MISTTCLVALALCLSPFSSGGKRNVGLDPDRFSSSLDLMKTVGVLCCGEEPSEGPSDDSEEIYLQKGQKM